MAPGEIFTEASMASRTSMSAVCAPDAQMAIRNARDVYTRRNEGVSIWAVRSFDIVASSPGDKEALFEPANNKVYRHPTFFPMPDEVKHI
jgi:ring-1,2-phenylacetyl-CoA epoxidase subunit PaaB